MTKPFGPVGDSSLGTRKSRRLNSQGYRMVNGFKIRDRDLSVINNSKPKKSEPETLSDENFQLVSTNTDEPPLTATFFLSHWTKNPAIESCLKPLYNGHFLLSPRWLLQRGSTVKLNKMTENINERQQKPTKILLCLVLHLNLPAQFNKLYHRVKK